MLLEGALPPTHFLHRVTEHKWDAVSHAIMAGWRGLLGSMEQNKSFHRRGDSMDQGSCNGSFLNVIFILPHKFLGFCSLVKFATFCTAFCGTCCLNSSLATRGGGGGREGHIFQDEISFYFFNGIKICIYILYVNLAFHIVIPCLFVFKI